MADIDTYPSRATLSSQDARLPSALTDYEQHVLAITQAICQYRALNNITGPVFLGIDTHALSEPAAATALVRRSWGQTTAVLQAQPMSATAPGAGLAPTARMVSMAAPLPAPMQFPFVGGAPGWFSTGGGSMLGAPHLSAWQAQPPYVHQEKKPALSFLPRKQKCGR